MEPFAVPSLSVAGNMDSRELNIMEGLCLASPLGCGRDVKADYHSWDDLTKREYRISGWCNRCQDKIFQDPDEERCTCDDEPCCSVDVGVGIIYCNHPQECPIHQNEDLQFHDRIYEHDLLENLNDLYTV